MQSKYKFDTSAERSSLMSKIKSNNTKAEVVLRKALFREGLRFRINAADLFGKPDISIKKYKLVIFVDGEFWHGFKWDEKKPKIKANRTYWIPKIERNIARDQSVNEHYKSLGWTIIRFWEHEIKKDLANCVQLIINNI